MICLLQDCLQLLNACFLSFPPVSLVSVDYYILHTELASRKKRKVSC